MSKAHTFDDFKNADLRLSHSHTESGSIHWTSPSNIALVKYWGKHGWQLPRNASISLTLNNAKSDTILHYSPKKHKDKTIDLSFFFDGEERPDFAARIEKFFSSLLELYPFLSDLHFEIRSSNSFPHSAGIASSASAMSALAMCLCELENRLFGTLNNTADFNRKASFLARLGSGSASRSIYPHLAVWGQHPSAAQSSDLYAIPFADQVHKTFSSYHDDILIISKKEKSVSSGAGHNLMEGNLYASNRYQQANQRMEQLIGCMQTGDLETFGQIVEAEALTLHALMMTSNPPYLLMEANSIHAIKAVQSFRQSTKLPLYFTLDAGPNLHLLYPDEITAQVKDFINNELVQYCENGLYLADHCGQGPEKIIEQA